MNMRLFYLVWMMLATSVCWAEPVINAQSPQSTEALFVDYVLGEEYASSVTKAIPLVIEEGLSAGWLVTINSVEECTADLVQDEKNPDKKLMEAVQDFCAKNSQASTIDAIGPLTVKHIVMTKTQMDELFADQGDGWDKFYQLYPESPGIITLSRPGFSADETLAVIYIGNQSHWLAGHGGIRIYRKKDGKWVDEREGLGPSWVS
ncbi:MAG TPA: hypothetical protein VLJ10_05230 [Candidatus Bathyarchaeia archaeon]|nr:hypothetical protein [Candidatus Bathyarchaeia archaeon]